MNTNENKKEFSWKWYLILVIISEIIAIILTLKLSFDYYSQNSHEMHEGLGHAILCLAIWFLNSLIIFVSSVVEFIKYKKYRANGCNSAMNIIIAILSSIMISIGSYCLNCSFESIFGGYIDSFFSSFLYLGIGIALIFPIFKSKKK